MKKIILLIIFLTTILFSQGNDRYGTYMSTWYECLIMFTDSTANHGTDQWMQDGRGNLLPISVSGNALYFGVGRINPTYKLDVLGTSLFTGNMTIIGNAGATTYTGDGSGLTGIASGTGGVINTGSTTIGADSDADGSGEIALQTRGSTRITVENLGDVIFNDKVGIGTINPQNKLDIEGGVVIGSGYSGTNTAPTNGLLVENKVGIGITDPYSELNINGEVRFFPREQQTLITFIIDDNDSSIVTVMKPLFDGQGEVACPAVVTDWIGNAGLLSSADLITMENDGWEILSHTATHARLPDSTDVVIRAELANSKTALEALGLTVNNMAYPFTANNETVRRITREYYRSGRAAENILNQHAIESYRLRAMTADDHTLLTTYQAFVDSAESQEKWAIFYLHTTDSDDSTAMNTLIDYIQAKNIDIVTVNEALDLIGNMVDIGDGFAVGEKGARITIAEELIFEETASIKFGTYPEFHAFGINNTFIGESSGNFTLSDAEDNVSLGRWALKNITDGDRNSAIGVLTMFNLTEGLTNTGIGNSALYSLTTGDENVGVGGYALYSITAVNALTGVGYYAGNQNTSGIENTYVGYYSGRHNQTGPYNTAVGYASQQGASGQSHDYNTSIGVRSLYSVTTGGRNTVLGFEAGEFLTTGEKNIVIGYESGDLLLTGSSNILIGYNVEASATDATYEMNIGDLLFADLSADHFGINTRVPFERLHIDEAGDTDGTGRWFANKSVTTTDGSVTGIYTLATTTDRAYRLMVNIIGIQDDGSNTMATSWSFVLKNVAGTVTELQDAVIGTEFDDSAGVLIDGAVSGTTYNIRVTGLVGENWNWEISIDATVVAH